MDPGVRRAAAEAAERWGGGSGSSRLIAGSLPIHLELEEALADWLGTEAALVCSSGYQANLALLQGLAGRGDCILSDALNHASLIDGCRLSRAAVQVLPHGEAAALREALAVPWEGERFVVGEGLYSMDGDRGAVSSWAAACETAGAHLLVDEAHAIGVLGPQGTGACAEAGLAARPLARVGTMGKALGAHGAFIACSRSTRELLVDTGRTYIFTTGIAPAAAGAALGGLRIVRSTRGAELRDRVRTLSRRVRTELARRGIEVLGDADSPILPIVVGEADPSMAVYRALLDDGIYAMAIRPPTVAPGTCRLRVTISAGHSDQDIEHLLRALGSALSS